MRIEENDMQLIVHLPHDPQTGHLVFGIGISFVLFGLEALKSMRSGFGWLSALWVGLFFSVCLDYLAAPFTLQEMAGLFSTERTCLPIRFTLSSGASGKAVIQYR